MRRHHPLRTFFLVVLLLTLAWPMAGRRAAAADPAKPAALGDKIANSNSLRDLHGNRRALHDFKGHKAVVLVFLGADCPVSNLYLPDILALEKKYRPQAVQFLGRLPQRGRRPRSGGRSRLRPRRAVPCPQGLRPEAGRRRRRDARADRRAIWTASSCCVTAAGSTTATAPARAAPRPTRDDLALALDEVLAGKKVSVAETEADGCLLDHEPKKSAKTTVTYAKDVARILQQRCQSLPSARPGGAVLPADLRRRGQACAE